MKYANLRFARGRGIVVDQQYRDSRTGGDHFPFAVTAGAFHVTVESSLAMLVRGKSSVEPDDPFVVAV